MQQYFISVEQQLIMESISLVSAIFLCVAAHYVFNLSYHRKTGDVWLFFQEKILGLQSKAGVKRHPSGSAHFSGISHTYESIKANDGFSDND